MNGHSLEQLWDSNDIEEFLARIEARKRAAYYLTKMGKCLKLQVKLMELVERDRINAGGVVRFNKRLEKMMLKCESNYRHDRDAFLDAEEEFFTLIKISDD